MVRGALTAEKAKDFQEVTMSAVAELGYKYCRTCLYEMALYGLSVELCADCTEIYLLQNLKLWHATCSTLLQSDDQSRLTLTSRMT